MQCSFHQRHTNNRCLWLVCKNATSTLSNLRRGGNDRPKAYCKAIAKDGMPKSKPDKTLDIQGSAKFWNKADMAGKLEGPQIGEVLFLDRVEIENNKKGAVALDG